jgi:RNA polymerase sigma-70 factor (ECF subfamily)
MGPPGQGVRIDAKEVERPARLPGLDMNRDAELLRAFREGDGDAYQELVRRYYDRIVWVAYSILHNEDVAQDTFLRLYRAAATYDESRNFYTWLYRIALNLAIDTLRKKGSRPAMPLDGFEEIVADPLGEAKSDLERKEVSQRIESVLGEIPHGYRVAIVLRDVHELSCKEIARLLGVSHAAARWRVHRARKLFRDAWVRSERRERHGVQPG